jgi:hypothetical protein
MPENHTDDHAQRRPFGYTLNVFPYRTLAEMWAFLEGEVGARKNFLVRCLSWAIYTYNKIFWRRLS